VKFHLKCISYIFLPVIIAVSLIAVIKIVKNIPDKRHPVANFVSIYLDRYIYCTDDDEDYSCGMIPQELKDIPFATFSSSGLMFNRVEGVTYILTAAHFCIQENSDYAIVSAEDLTNEIYVRTDNSLRYDAEVIHYDTDTDICLMSSDIPIDRSISLSKKMPLEGSKIYYVGAPIGVHIPNASARFEGIYSGCNGERCVYTIPSAHGSSGSLIINRRGDIVGMVLASVIDFNYITLGVGVRELREFLEMCSTYLNIELMP